MDAGSFFMGTGSLFFGWVGCCSWVVVVVCGCCILFVGAGLLFVDPGLSFVGGQAHLCVVHLVCGWGADVCGQVVCGWVVHGLGCGLWVWWCHVMCHVLTISKI